MTSLTIADIKDFTGKLFLAEVFDNFLTTEAEFFTTFQVTLDGHLLEREKDCPDEYVRWKKIRPLAFQIIKGKQLPKSFHIVFKLAGENVPRTLQSMGVPFTEEDVAGLYLNIRYENHQIYCVTGCSLRTFSLDKSLEKEWDEVIKRFLRHHQIPFEEA